MIMFSHFEMDNAVIGRCVCRGYGGLITSLLLVWNSWHSALVRKSSACQST